MWPIQLDFWKIFPPELGILCFGAWWRQSWCFQCPLLFSLAKQILVPQFPELSKSSCEDPPCKNLPPSPPPPPPALLTGTDCDKFIFYSSFSHMILQSLLQQLFLLFCSKKHPNPPAPPHKAHYLLFTHLLLFKVISLKYKLQSQRKRIKWQKPFSAWAEECKPDLLRAIFKQVELCLSQKNYWHSSKQK